MLGLVLLVRQVGLLLSGCEQAMNVKVNFSSWCEEGILCFQFKKCLGNCAYIIFGHLSLDEMAVGW